MNSTDVKRKNKNTLLAIILLAAVVVVFGVYFGIMGHKSGPVDVSELKIDGTILKEPGMSPTFNLTDNNGQAVNEEIFKGRWNLVFFGFTNCGYVCPTSLAALKQMYEQLDKQLPAEKMPQVIMVSVDPARDSYQRMGDYVHSFNSHFIGLRGDDGATDAIKKQMNIVAVKMAAKNGDPNSYSINHTAETFVIDPEGRLRAYLSFPHTGPELSKDYLTIVNNLS